MDLYNVYTTCKRHVSSASRFRFTRIAPKCHKSIKILLDHRRELSLMPPTFFFIFHLDAKAVKRIRGCVEIFNLVYRTVWGFETFWHFSYIKRYNGYTQLNEKIFNSQIFTVPRSNRSVDFSTPNTRISLSLIFFLRVKIHEDSLLKNVCIILLNKIEQFSENLEWDFFVQKDANNYLNFQPWKFLTVTHV